MYRSVIVPLDTSRSAEHALPVAAEMARRARATLDLVCVNTPRWRNFGAGRRMNEDLRTFQLAYLDDVRDRVLATSGLRADRVTTRVLDHPIVDTLRRFVNAKRASLVVMTTHGRTGINRAWLGSVADGLLRSSRRPVLLLRATRGKAAIPPLRSILVPIDSSKRSERILPDVVEVAELVGARITLLRVVEREMLPVHPYAYAASPTRPDVERQRALVAAAQRQLDRLAVAYGARHPRVGIRVEVRIADHVAATILAAAAEIHADLIAMSTSGRGASRLLIGSVADKVLRAATIPLLLHRQGEMKSSSGPTLR